VKSYCTRYSGIRAADVDGTTHPTLSLAETRAAIIPLIQDKVLVGHGIKGDLDALGWPRKDVLQVCHSILDTLNLDWGERPSTGLASLTKELFQVTIQEGEHDPVEDALYTMKLALEHRRLGGPPPLPRVTVNVNDDEVVVSWCRRELGALFRRAAEEGKVVRFPADISKKSRKLVHDVARDTPHVASSSQGLGEERHVRVSRAEGGGKRDDDEYELRGEALYRSARERAGMNEISRAECVEALRVHAEGGEVPPALLRLIGEDDGGEGRYDERRGEELYKRARESGLDGVSKGACVEALRKHAVGAKVSPALLRLFPPRVRRYDQDRDAEAVRRIWPAALLQNLATYR
jgi:hypothetical protein